MTEETIDITPEAAAGLGEQLAHAFDARTVEPGIPTREPEETWPLQDGTAWVYRVPGNPTLTKPVIIADGFGAGASDLREWSGLWGIGVAGVHAWGNQLHERGRDVIVLGYDSRNVSIVDNANVAMECIKKTIADKDDNGERLVVGGLSMGGLVTRYALAQLEKEEFDHETAVYFSYDSPHRGAWIPISLQVFAHFMAAVADDLFDTGLIDEETKQKMKGLQALVNSTAARQLLWTHTETHLGVGPSFTADTARQEFLTALEDIGDWPQNVRRLGVANGRGDGEGLLDEDTQGDPNLVWPKTFLRPGATLYVQAAGSGRTVAELHKAISGKTTVKTSDIPALDGAPGGTLNSFGLAAKALTDEGYGATVEYPDVCFVPVASAVDVAEPSEPYEPVKPDAVSGLHDFKVASQNEGHGLLTAELCDWLTDEFDRTDTSGGDGAGDSVRMRHAHH